MRGVNKKFCIIEISWNLIYQRSPFCNPKIFVSCWCVYVCDELQRFQRIVFHHTKEKDFFEDVLKVVELFTKWFVYFDKYLSTFISLHTAVESCLQDFWVNAFKRRENASKKMKKKFKLNMRWKNEGGI
jgi:hypothetical protein